MATASFDPGAKLERIRRAIANPERALKQVGVIMVAESQRAFRDQGFGSAQWAPRGVPNVFGILADFAAGKSEPPRRRFEPRPALQDTGRLAASIAFEVVGRDSVRVGSNLDYAEVMHRGGKIQSVMIDGRVRSELWRWLRRQPRAIKRQLGWLLNQRFKGKKLEHEVPARPFVGVTDRTIAAVKATIGVAIMEVEQ